VDDRPSDEYFCNSMGCSNGYGSSFYAAPAFWFQERGFSLPKNCPDCRRWIKEQTDEVVYCNDCNYMMRLPARYKISHHKRTGPWERPTQCRRCERGAKAEQSYRGLPRRERQELPVRRDEDTFDSIANGITVQERIVDINAQNYQHMVGRRQSETRQTHIEHHMAASSHSLVGHGKSVSALGERGEDFASLLEQARDLMAITDPAMTREYLEDDKIVRLTLLTDGYIERTVIMAQPGPNGHELVTTFDGITVTSAKARYGSKPNPK